MDRRAERIANEIKQGLRTPKGSLIGGLDILAYAQGHEDFKNGHPFPDDPSVSYELGRNAAREDAEDKADALAWIKREDARRDAAMREILKYRPDLLAEHEAKMKEIRA